MLSKNRLTITMLLTIVSIMVLLQTNSLAAADYKLNLIKRFYSIGTATINGTYFPVGNSIARALSKNLKNLIFVAEPTEGSVANVEYLRKSQIDLSLMQSDVAWQAAKGVGIFVDNPFRELRVLASLYSEVVQIIVKKNSPIKTIIDLKGCKISVGSKESGSAVNAIQVMTAAGLQPNDYELTYERFTRATESLHDGYVDAVYYTGAVPADGISRLAAKTELRMLEIPAEVQNRLIKEYPYFSLENIPAGSYKGLTKSLNTIGLRALLVTSEQLSNFEAQRILEVIYQHPSLIFEKNTPNQNFRKEDAGKGIEPETLHQGAINYFSRPRN